MKEALAYFQLALYPKRTNLYLCIAKLNKKTTAGARKHLQISYFTSSQLSAQKRKQIHIYIWSIPQLIESILGKSSSMDTAKLRVSPVSCNRQSKHQRQSKCKRITNRRESKRNPNTAKTTQELCCWLEPKNEQKTSLPYLISTLMLLLLK